MSKFLNHFDSLGKEMKIKFERTRATMSDSGVKGAQNENIVASFLSQHVPAWLITTNVQILDSYDNISDEVDVCVCNYDQPFRQSEGGVFIAEGVDFTVQVKAILNTEELKRIEQNCKTVKALERKTSNGDSLMQPIGLRQELFSRIPYIVFAFASSLSPDTVHKSLVHSAKDTPYSEQIDALFILDRGISFINLRDTEERTWTMDGKPIFGWLRQESGDATLVEFLKFIHLHVPRIRRLGSPIAHYFPKEIQHNVLLLNK